MQNIKTFCLMFKQLLGILNQKQKRMAVLIGILSMVSAMLETLGISVVIPFILVMLEPESIKQNHYVKLLINTLKIDNNMMLLLVFAVLIITVYVCKNCFILMTAFVQTKFRNDLEMDLSILMMKSYLYRPYLFHVNTNSAEILRGITGDTSGVATVVDCYTILLNEGLTCILIGAILIGMNPFLAVGLLGIIGITSLFIILFMRKIISKCGVECRDSLSDRLKVATQTIGGIKEVDVMHRQDNFLQTFSNISSKACRYNTKYLCLSKVPSRLIEVVFISSLIGLVYMCLNTRMNTSMMIAQFGTLAIAAMRVLPSVNSITTTMNSLIYNRPALEGSNENIDAARKIISEYDALKKVSIKEANNKGFSKIEINNIVWAYRENTKNVLENVSLAIKRGESVAFVGESGAGKTTLADIILGLYQPQQGAVYMDGVDIKTIPLQWAKTVGYVPQNVFLLDDSIRNNILFGIPQGDKNDDLIWNALEQAQLKEFVEKLPEQLDTVVGERGVKFSGGQRQRIAIARALYYNPDILVMDEATSALDNETEKALMESIEKLQGHKTLIIVAHRLSTIEKCDSIYEVSNKQLIKRK